jgi:hypothetical protein
LLRAQHTLKRLRPAKIYSLPQDFSITLLARFARQVARLLQLCALGQAGCLAMIFLERSSPLPARIRQDWKNVLAASLPVPNGEPCE